MIQAQQLCARFGKRPVVNDVSFTVESGSVVGFLGPNGAGKTTTMRMLAGFLEPARGHALICGHDVRRRRRDAQTCLGYLPEAAVAYPNLTVREFLSFCGEARGLRGPRLRECLERVCDQIDLGSALHLKIKELSKGWRQRAWFAQALLHDPPALILDEPTDGLDPNQKKQVRALIRTLAPSKAILLSTHILEEAEEICDRAIIIAQGRVVVDDTPSRLADENGRIAAAFYRLTAQDPAA